MSATLFLIPSPLGYGRSIPDLTAPEVVQELTNLSHFVVESRKQARQFLKEMRCAVPLQQLTLKELPSHDLSLFIDQVVGELTAGCSYGLLSDAGYPCIADPGRELVLAAQRAGVIVRPLVGPTSLMLALAASGLPGQSFFMHGYLPREKDALRLKLLEVERLSRQNKVTQLFIETPYRNQSLFEVILKTCHRSTLITVGCNLTQEDQYVKTAPCEVWIKLERKLACVPTVFCLFAAD
jgi:16S rRNA (cytidine1402-2'-O)-methyltransferase